VVKQSPDCGAFAEADMQLLKYICSLIGVSVGDDLSVQGAGETFWPDLTRIASEQLVLTVMAGTTARLNGLPPGADEATAFFRQIAETGRERNRWLLEQLEQAAGALHGAGIPAMVMKGGAFLLEDRENAAAWRFFGDMDFMVPEDRLADGVAVLKELGYQDPGRAYHPEFQRHYPFLNHPEGTSGIDLHTRPAGLDQSALLDAGHYFAHAETIELPDGQVMVPSPTDRMAHLIVNAQILDYRYKRRLFRLRDVLDFSRLVQRNEVDMNEIWKRFEAYGQVRPLMAYLAAMGRVLGPCYRAPEESAGEHGWMDAAARVIQDPRRARIHVIRHWFQMLYETLSDGARRRHLFRRLVDREQRAEFIGRRMSYWKVFRR
jgi:hypothetical protein